MGAESTAAKITRPESLETIVVRNWPLTVPGDAVSQGRGIASTERSSVDRFAALFAKSRTRWRGNCGEVLNLLRSSDRSGEANLLRA